MNPHNFGDSLTFNWSSTDIYKHCLCVWFKNMLTRIPKKEGFCFSKVKESIRIHWIWKHTCVCLCVPLWGRLLCKPASLEQRLTSRSKYRRHHLYEWLVVDGHIDAEHLEPVLGHVFCTHAVDWLWGQTDYLCPSTQLWECNGAYVSPISNAKWEAP